MKRLRGGDLKSNNTLSINNIWKKWLINYKLTATSKGKSRNIQKGK